MKSILASMAVGSIAGMALGAVVCYQLCPKGLMRGARRAVRMGRHRVGQCVRHMHI